MGKISNLNLKKLLNCIKTDKRVTVPPMLGYDSGVHRLGDKYVVISTDPCIGVPEEWFGWLLINYAASDVALFGAKPEFCTITLIGPSDTAPREFHEAMSQACGAADELGLTIVTGHTGTYDGLSKLAGVCTAYGTIEKEKLITPGDAKPGDQILCTKTIGFETLVNFSLTHKALAQQLFGTKQTTKLSKLVRMQSCVREALQLAEVGGVHAMHDATEGGLVAALNEMTEASKVGFEVEMAKMPITTEVRILQDHFRLSDEQVLAMSSTGTVLAAVDAKAKDSVEETLRKIGVSSSFVGDFTKNKERLLIKNKKFLKFSHAADDPYNKILSAQV